MNATERIVVEAVMKMLERQKFFDWYREGRFNDYLCGMLPRVEKETVLNDLYKMLYPE